MWISDLGVSVWVWKSEIIELINSGEGISSSVVRASSFSETGLLGIIATSVSDDVERVDGLFSKLFDSRCNESFASSSLFLKKSKLSFGEFFENLDAVLDHSGDSGSGGISLVLN